MIHTTVQNSITRALDFILQIPVQGPPRRDMQTFPARRDYVDLTATPPQSGLCSPLARLVRECTHVDNDRLAFSESNPTSRRWAVQDVHDAEAGTAAVRRACCDSCRKLVDDPIPSRTGESDSPSKRRKLIAAPFFIVATPLIFFGTAFLSIAVWISGDDSYWEQSERP